MKNIKKVKRSELKTIKGGAPSYGKVCKRKDGTSYCAPLDACGGWQI